VTHSELEPETAPPPEPEPIGDTAELQLEEEKGNISDVTDDDIYSRGSLDDSVSNMDDEVNAGENDDINNTETATPEDVINVLDQRSIKLTVTDISNNTAKTYPDCL
jgi:hypothetical protein